MFGNQILSSYHLLKTGSGLLVKEREVFFFFFLRSGKGSVNNQYTCDLPVTLVQLSK